MTRGRLAALAASPWLQVALTFGLSALLAVVSHRAWKADLAVPWMYSLDGLQYLMYSKAIHDNGWFIENGLLGAPFGLFLYDWPEGGWASFLGVRLIDLLTGNWVAAHNLFYLLGYPLAALTCLWALRRLAVAPALAITLAVLYSILPYHLDRQMHHYVLGLYYGLPPLLSYAVTTAAGREPIPLRRGALSRGAWLRRLVGPVSAAVLAGLMSAYYVAFAGILLLAGGLFGWLASGRRRVLASMLVLGMVFGTAFIAQYAPTLLYRLANGTNSDVSGRYIGEIELYPLKLADLLLPVPNHPISTFAYLRQRYSEFPSRGQVGLALGVLGSAGLMLTLGGLTAAAAGRGRRGSLVARLRPLGWLVVVGLAVGMLGGLATLLSMIVGPYLRAWDRIAIAVAFLAFAGLGVTLTVLRRRLRRALRAPALAGLAALLLVGGAVDQAGTGVWVRPYEALAAQWHADRGFFTQVEQLLPDGAMVYQLPYIPFPEWGSGELHQLDHVRAYLHSDDLRWSYGYMRGREPGWQAIASSAPLADVLTLAQAVGYAGVYVNLDGYPTWPGSPLTGALVASQLDAQLGRPAIESGPMRFHLLDGAPADGPAARDAADPVWLRWASGFDLMGRVEGHITHRARGVAEVELTNRRAAPREVVASLVLVPEYGPGRTVELRWPDGVVETIVVGTEAVHHRRQLVLPAGRSALGLAVPGAPPRGYAWTLADLAVVDLSLAPLLPAWQP